jgi:peptide/nickel transport system ATP-binding protein
VSAITEQGPIAESGVDDAALLDVTDLRTYFKTEDGIVKAVDGVSFSVKPGETLGVVGESGCGKSVTMLSVLSLNPKMGRIHPAADADVDAEMQAFLLDSKKHSSLSTGTAMFRGKDLLKTSGDELRQIRGGEIAMIFQDPMTSLNPVHSVGAQLVEAALLHQDLSKRDAKELAIASLDDVGIPRAKQRINDYPHQFSGGMRQRVMIAMALINEPALLIADEPTTALDVTTQSQILGLIRRLQEERGTAVLMITHDLGVIAEVADEVVVMYAGRVVERAGVFDLFEKPRHPYTWGLLGSLPHPDAVADRLTQIQGQPPSLLNPPQGCRFNPRCSHTFDRCRSERPELHGAAADPNHLDACFLDESRKLEEATRLVAGLGRTDAS